MSVVPTIAWAELLSWLPPEPTPANSAPDISWNHEERAPMPNPAQLPATGWLLKAAVNVTGSVSGDPYPKGHLVFAVSPTTGVTMADMNGDEQGIGNYIGNGKYVCNWTDQAEGEVYCVFASAGTFTLSCEYVSGDSNYSSVKLATTLEIVVA